MTVCNGLANRFQKCITQASVHTFVLYTAVVNLHTMSASVSILLLKKTRQEGGVR